MSLTPMPVPPLPATQMVRRDEALETLADHCMAARALIEEAGTTSMRQLVDLLLYEVGLSLAKAAPLELVTELDERMV